MRSPDCRGACEAWTSVGRARAGVTSSWALGNLLRRSGRFICTLVTIKNGARGEGLASPESWSLTIAPSINWENKHGARGEGLASPESRSLTIASSMLQPEHDSELLLNIFRVLARRVTSGGFRRTAFGSCCGGSRCKIFLAEGGFSLPCGIGPSGTPRGEAYAGASPSVLALASSSVVLVLASAVFLSAAPQRPRLPPAS